MSEYQIVVIAALYVVIVLTIAVSIPLNIIMKKVKRIEALLLSTKENTDNKDKVCD